MSASQATSIAIIGTGASVGNHLTAIRKLGDRVNLVAAVDINPARLNVVCAENNIPHAYADAAEMLAAEKPDVVCIVTPPATHKQLVITCLEAGAWVYCEKPLCASLAEFDEIDQAEGRTGNYVSTVFQWRTGSAARHVKRLIENGAAGKPLVGVCNTLWYRTPEYYGLPYRGKWASEIGGPTATLGIHLVDLFLWLMGDWQEVRAMVGTLDRAIEVEDVAMAMVRFESGAMGSIVNSVLSPRQESYLRLDFQQATVECSALYRYQNEHWRLSLPDGIAESVSSAYWQTMSDNIASAHHIQLGELLDAKANGQRPPVSGPEARRILEFIASLYKSAFTGQPVQRGSITPDDPHYFAMNGAPLAVEKA